jgi:hypothetical protein
MKFKFRTRASHFYIALDKLKKQLYQDLVRPCDAVHINNDKEVQE